MGTKLSTAKSHQRILLQSCIDGNVDVVKETVGSFLASYSHSNVGFVDVDPKLREYVNQADEQGNNAMHGAVFAGNIEIVKYLYEDCGASLVLANNLGCFPLWLAAGYNRIQVLHYLFSMLSDPQQELLRTNKTGDTCLVAAASRGNIEICQIVMDNAKAMGVLNELMETTNAGGDSALSIAVAGGHSTLLDLILPYTSKTMINHPNHKGVTPLLVACERDDVGLCEKLLHNGASLDVTDTSTGASPLAVAAFCGSDNVIEKLLLQQQPPLRLEQSNTNGCTPLWLAARSGRDKIVKLLLEAGADPCVANKDGLTPVDVAIKFKRESVMQLFKNMK
jgi:ankyrin repeat protein